MHAGVAWRRHAAAVARRCAVRLAIVCSTGALARCGYLQGTRARLVGVTLFERQHRGLLFRGVLLLIGVAAQRDRLVPRRAVKLDDEDVRVGTQPAPPRGREG